MEKIISVDGFEEEGVLWVVEGDIGVKTKKLIISSKHTRNKENC